MNQTAKYTFRCDFVNLDEMIQSQKLTPDYIDIPIPRYFTCEDRRRLDERDQMIDNWLIEYQGTKLPIEERFDERT